MELDLSTCVPGVSELVARLSLRTPTEKAGFGCYAVLAHAHC